MEWRESIRPLQQNTLFLLLTLCVLNMHFLDVMYETNDQKSGYLGVFSLFYS